MNKYNNQKCVLNGHTFDSRLEMQFYEHLLGLQEKGLIEEIKLQPKYILFEGYTLEGKKVRPITYSADFEIIYSDGKCEVVDVKGFVTETFAIKKKLFEGKFHIPLKLVTYTKIDGWVTLDELKEARKKRKQLKLSKK